VAVYVSDAHHPVTLGAVGVLVGFGFGLVCGVWRVADLADDATIRLEESERASSCCAALSGPGVIVAMGFFAALF